MTRTVRRSLESVKQIAADVVARFGQRLVVVGVTAGEANGSYTEVMFGDQCQGPIIIGVARNESDADLRRRIADGLRQHFDHVHN